MARLNEQSASTDNSLEILRRKFLRQNRDIARINSDQSQKIRRLENDCARLLSENLELRAQIVRLEKKLEENTAQRIADHALEVKAKLEAQLAEFSSLISSLGVEPAPKRRALERQPQRSLLRSPPQRRRRTSEEEEALAEAEGRLPPIFENKPYPRATMNSEEILALCAAAEDVEGSPDIGPPPVSRFAEEDDAAEDDNVPSSPMVMSPAHESPKETHVPPSPPKLDYDRKPMGSPEPMEDVAETELIAATPQKDTMSPTKQSSAQTPTLPTVRAGTKRKFADENENLIYVATSTGKEKSVLVEKDKDKASTRANKRRSIRDNNGTVRMPLAVKSTNDDLTTPRKAAAKALADSKKEPVKRARAGFAVKADDASAEVDIPPAVSEPPAVATVTVDTDTAPSSPSTPNNNRVDSSRRNKTVNTSNDTPPPADISSTGETSRPTRRARIPISYAEPNLRDKMRRPTKELFDAVSGEGKFVHRAILTGKLDEIMPTSLTKAKSSDPGSATSSKAGASHEKSVKTSSGSRRQTSLSPLAKKEKGKKDQEEKGEEEEEEEKEEEEEEEERGQDQKRSIVVEEGVLPSTVTTERKKRSSARESLAVAAEKPEADSSLSSSANASATATNRTKAAVPDKLHPDNSPANDVPSHDPYDFTASSPAPEPAAPIQAPAPARSRAARKSSMAAAAALREILQDDDDDSTEQKQTAAKKAVARKRQSMLVPKKTSGSFFGLVEEDDKGEEGPDEADTSASSLGSAGSVESTGSVAGRVGMRRRSMML